jgi:hypothetical protein
MREKEQLNMVMTKDKIEELSRQQPLNTPAILYKYRNFDEEGYNLKALEESKLWFSSADRFNDPYDSTIQFDYSTVDRKTVFKWGLHNIKRDNPHLSIIEQMKLTEENINRNILDPVELERSIDGNKQQTLKKFGICSLTSDSKNLLMWSHYADCHKGFCFGIDTKKLLSIQNYYATKKEILTLYRMDYRSDIPNYNFFESMLENYGEKYISHLLLVKSEEWKYEKEYRLSILGHTNVALPIFKEAIVEIYLGCKIKDDNRDAILNTLDDIKSPAKVYQLHKSEIKFELTPIQIR